MADNSCFLKCLGVAAWLNTPPCGCSSTRLPSPLPFIPPFCRLFHLPPFPLLVPGEHWSLLKIKRHLSSFSALYFSQPCKGGKKIFKPVVTARISLVSSAWVSNLMLKRQNISQFQSYIMYMYMVMQHVKSEADSFPLTGDENLSVKCECLFLGQLISSHGVTACTCCLWRWKSLLIKLCLL